ncbi:unnamed protein product [Cyclocybe aegerita]|uniref:Uncharacterized protein n=1 Tax=Cyclocybe aegerita TaxID=1973307 RepID=A0A8S0WSB2_CYCAE|nr:unnamed protein product [Cyclocybe aegerita]
MSRIPQPPSSRPSLKPPSTPGKTRITTGSTPIRTRTQSTPRSPAPAKAKVASQPPPPSPAPSAPALSIKEAIALKRAEAKKAQEKAGSGGLDNLGSLEDALPDAPKQEEDDLLGRLTVRDTIESARSTGSLNLATRSLVCLPSALFEMHLGLTPDPLKSVPQEPVLPPSEPTSSRRGGNQNKAAWYEAQDLTVLKAWNNEIEELQHEISLFGSLKTVDLHKNRLASLPNTFADLTALTVLDLSHNALTSVPDNLWALPELTTLNLSHNQLTALPFNAPFVGTTGRSKNARQPSGGFFTPAITRATTPLPHLVSLDASSNKISAAAIHDQLPVSLTKVDLSRNPLGQSQQFLRNLASLKRLKELRFEHAEIGDDSFPLSLVSFVPFPSLRILDVSETQVNLSAAKDALKQMTQELNFDFSTEEPPMGVTRVLVGKRIVKEPWELELEQRAKSRAHTTVNFGDDWTDALPPPRSTSRTSTASPTPPPKASAAIPKKVIQPKEVQKEAWEIEAEQGLLTEGGKRRARAAAAAAASQAELGKGSPPTAEGPSSSPSPSTSMGLSSPQYYTPTTQTLQLPASAPPTKSAGHFRAFSVAAPSSFPKTPARNGDLAVPTPTLPLSTIVTQPFASTLRVLILANRRLDRSFDLPSTPESVPISGFLPCLEELDLEGCNLGDLVAVHHASDPASTPPRSSELIIPTLSKLFPSLRTLNLSYNGLTSFALTPDALSTLILDSPHRKGLRHLRLRGNKISELDGFVKISESFKGNREVAGWKMEELDLRDNEIGKLPPELGLLPLDVFLVDGNTFRVPQRRYPTLSAALQLHYTPASRQALEDSHRAVMTCDGKPSLWPLIPPNTGASAGEALRATAERCKVSADGLHPTAFDFPAIYTRSRSFLRALSSTGTRCESPAEAMSMRSANVPFPSKEDKHESREGTSTPSTEPEMRISVSSSTGRNSHATTSSSKLTSSDKLTALPAHLRTSSHPNLYRGSGSPNPEPGGTNLASPSIDLDSRGTPSPSKTASGASTPIQGNITSSSHRQSRASNFALPSLTRGFRHSLDASASLPSFYATDYSAPMLGHSISAPTPNFSPSNSGGHTRQPTPTPTPENGSPKQRVSFDSDRHSLPTPRGVGQVFARLRGSDTPTHTPAARASPSEHHRDAETPGSHSQHLRSRSPSQSRSRAASPLRFLHQWSSGFHRGNQTPLEDPFIPVDPYRFQLRFPFCCQASTQKVPDVEEGTASAFSGAYDCDDLLPIEEVKTSFANARLFITDTLPRELYLNLLLRLPAMYFSRVARIFEDADVSKPDIQRMIDASNAGGMRRPSTTVPANLTTEYPHTMPAHGTPGHGPAAAIPPGVLSGIGLSTSVGTAPAASMMHMPLPFPDEWSPPLVSPALIRFKHSWESFIDSLLREWKTLNVVSALLGSAIFTIFQIPEAASDPITRTLALISLICALMSLSYGCMYIVRFGTMRSMFHASRWAEEARKTKTSIWWNVWVLLATPAVWMAWSMLLFLSAILSFVWRTGSVLDPEQRPPLSAKVALVPRIIITSVFFLGMVYLCMIVKTLKKYGSHQSSARALLRVGHTPPDHNLTAAARAEALANRGRSKTKVGQDNDEMERRGRERHRSTSTHVRRREDDLEEPREKRTRKDAGHLSLKKARSHGFKGLLGPGVASRVETEAPSDAEVEMDVKLPTEVLVAEIPLPK